MKAGKLREMVRFKDRAFETGTVCSVAEPGAERDEIMRAMRGEYESRGNASTVWLSAFWDEVQKKVNKRDLSVIRIAGDRWRLVAAARVEEST